MKLFRFKHRVNSNEKTVKIIVNSRVNSKNQNYPDLLEPSGKQISWSERSCAPTNC